MSDLSTNLHLPFLAAAQAQKHVTVNESLLRLDALVQSVAASRTTTSEPGAPADGALYILPSGKSGAAWGAMAVGAIAYWRDGAWEEIAPRQGWTMFVQDEAVQVVFDAAAWRLSACRSHNRLHNAAFAIDQRQLASYADDAYCFDRWYVLTQSNAIAVSALSNPEVGRPTGIRLTQSHATPQRIGLAQIVESADIRDLRQHMVAMATRIRCSSTQAIRMAILEWTGTADAVVSDVVNAWTNASFTAGQFFKSTSTSVVATGAVTPAVDTWTALGDVHGALSASATNVIVMIWTESTLAQNATLDLDEVQLEPGASCGAFVRRPAGLELQICQRFFELHPGAREGGFAGQGVRVSTAILDLPITFRTQKRSTPTLVHSSPTWATTTPTTGNDIASADIATSTFTTISGALTPSLVLPNTRIAVLRLTAGTSFSGSAATFGNVLVGASVLLGYSADL